MAATNDVHGAAATLPATVYHDLRVSVGRPCEARGVLADGRPFHFRARGGVWQVRVALDPDADAAEGVVVAQGPDRTGGVMWREEVVEVLDAYLPDVVR